MSSRCLSAFEQPQLFAEDVIAYADVLRGLGIPTDPSAFGR
jgi:hypothetical protein